MINHPRALLDTGRAANVRRLHGLPNVVVPRMVTLPRQALAARDAASLVASKGITFPLLLRAPGFHTGQHFVRAETMEQLAAAAADFPGDGVWLIEPLDARGDDGMFRKYRVMFVGGKMYPLHLAISRRWKVHYFTADMADDADQRAADAAFLDDMDGVIGRKAVAALNRIRATLRLDYGGIDFAVSRGGDVLFFEANATMVVYPPVEDPKWAYRPAAVEAVLAAVRTMLVDRSRSSAA